MRDPNLVLPLLEQFTYEMDDEIIKFSLVKTAGDGDCFFYAVNKNGFTRESLITKLIENSSEKWVRDGFAHEIFQFLYLGYTHPHERTIEQAACEQLLTTEIKELFVAYDSAVAKLAPIVNSIKEEYGEANFKSKTHEEILEFLEKEQSNFWEEFKNANNSVAEAKDNIITYCSSENVFLNYVNLYLKDAKGYIPFSRDFGKQLEVTTIDVINRLFKLNILVHLQLNKEDSKLFLANYPQEGDSIPVFHNGINHFSGLSLVGQNKNALNSDAGELSISEESSGSYQRFAGKDIFIIENYYGDKSECDSSVEDFPVAPDFASVYDIYETKEKLTEARVNSFKCPITRKIMSDPVILNILLHDNGEEVAGSHIYEREAIISFLATIYAEKKKINSAQTLRDIKNGIDLPVPDGCENVQIGEYQLEQLIRDDYALYLLSDLPQANCELIESGEIYLKSDGTYYVRDYDGCLQSGALSAEITYELNTDFNKPKLQDVNFRHKIIFDITLQGHTICMISDQDKKNEISEFLGLYPECRNLAYLPKKWKDVLCSLICEYHSDEKQRLDKIKYYLSKDPRLLTVSLSGAAHKLMPITQSSVYTPTISVSVASSGVSSPVLFTQHSGRLTDTSSLYCSEYSEPEVVVIDDNFYDEDDFSFDTENFVELSTVYYSPFCLAGMLGSVNMVKLILKELQNANLIDIEVKPWIAAHEDGQQIALPYADIVLKETLDVTINNKEDFISLFKLGASITQSNKSNQYNTLLHDLAKIGNPNAEWLITEPDKQAAELKVNNYWGTSSELLEARNDRGNTPLHIAVKNNQTKLIGVFLRYEFNINIKNMDEDTPLHLAINHISCDQSSCDLPMALLVNIKEDKCKEECVSTANKVGDISLHLAIRKGNSNLVEVLLKFGAKETIANKAGYTSIYLASTENKQNILDLLLGEKYMDCHTHLAIELEDDKLLNYWINKTKTETKNKLGQTPLYFAVINNKYNAVNILLGAKANISFTYGEKQQTIFHFLASNLDMVTTGSIILRTILAHVEKCITRVLALNKRDAEGNTALHLAAISGNGNLFELLLKAGADSNIPNNDGVTPVNVAGPECKLDIIRVINKHSAIKQPITYLYSMQDQFPQNNIQWSKPLSNGYVAVCTDIIEIVDPRNKSSSIYLPGATMLKECIISLSNGDIGSVCDLNKVQIKSTNKIYKLSHGNEAIVWIQELENYNLASVSDRGTIEVWRLSDRSHLFSINSGDTSITCFSLYTSGKSHTIAHGSSRGTVQVWILNDGENARYFRTLQYDAAVQCLKLIPNNNLLVVGFSTGDIILVDLKSGKDLQKVSAHSSAVYCIVSNIDEDEMCNLYSASDDGSIKKWNINFATNDMECIQTLEKKGAYLFDHIGLEANIVVVSQSDEGCNVEITNFEKLIAQQESTESLTASQNCCMM